MVARKLYERRTTDEVIPADAAGAERSDTTATAGAVAGRRGCDKGAVRFVVDVVLIFFEEAPPDGNRNGAVAAVAAGSSPRAVW